MISLTPLDGRYASRVTSLLPFMSEDAFIRYRVYVEVEWLIYFCEVTDIAMSDKLQSSLRKKASDFGEKEAHEVREIETVTNHDVKAVEIWVGQLCNRLSRPDLIPFVHIGRTSEDINNVAYALMLRGCRQEVLMMEFNTLLSMLKKLAMESSKMPMLARTHGQPASPTTFGKEVAVFISRLKNQTNNVMNVSVCAKFNGATGTYAADYIAYPDVNWPVIMDEFMGTLGLEFNPLTTQIEPHDWIARLCNELALSGSICIDLSRDFWQYISMGYLKQSVVEGEVGSSTMPHKVNPIDFENAEANFGIANALFRYLSEKLPISRLQRDLSDSSALRSLSEALGHYLLALKSLQKGLSKVKPDKARMLADLENEWSILTEAVQTVMRSNGIADAYDQMKNLSRGKPISAENLRGFIQTLNIKIEDKKRLTELTPQAYIGVASELSETVWSPYKRGSKALKGSR